jgi:FKBP-type peptidyl-prolyl cis-trans isomerase 2
MVNSASGNHPETLMKNIGVVRTVSIIGVLLLGCDIGAQTESGDKVIKGGSRVSMEYTLSDTNGTVIESNKGKKPLLYTHGQGQIIPGLEKGLEGMKVGGEKKIEVKPEEGYGPVDPKAFREVPKANLPAEALKVGTQLTATTPQGQAIAVRVHEIKDDTVIIDFNHPLAGKTISFDVKILNIQDSDIK